MCVLLCTHGQCISARKSHSQIHPRSLLCVVEESRVCASVCESNDLLSTEWSVFHVQVLGQHASGRDPCFAVAADGSD